MTVPIKREPWHFQAVWLCRIFYLVDQKPLGKIVRVFSALTSIMPGVKDKWYENFSSLLSGPSFAIFPFPYSTIPSLFPYFYLLPYAVYYDNDSVIFINDFIIDCLLFKYGSLLLDFCEWHYKFEYLIHYNILVINDTRSCLILGMNTWTCLFSDKGLTTLLFLTCCL